jgi:hypothetical protein
MVRSSPLSETGKTRYIYNMKNNNPYVQTLLEKGYTAAECRTPAPKQKFPLTIYGRTFETEAAYNEAIYEFLNNN